MIVTRIEKDVKSTALDKTTKEPCIYGTKDGTLNYSSNRGLEEKYQSAKLPERGNQEEEHIHKIYMKQCLKAKKKEKKSAGFGK